MTDESKPDWLRMPPEGTKVTSTGDSTGNLSMFADFGGNPVFDKIAPKTDELRAEFENMCKERGWDETNHLIWIGFEAARTISEKQLELAEKAYNACADKIPGGLDCDRKPLKAALSAIGITVRISNV